MKRHAKRGKAKEMSTNVESHADCLNSFALKLFQHECAGKAENYFISPSSIVSGLSMALSGARNETADQLKSLLNLTNLSNQQIFDLQSRYSKTLSEFKSNVDLIVADRVYSKRGYSLKKKFTDNLAKYYGNEVESLDFPDAQQSAKTINDWISNKTNEKIQNLLSPDLFDELTRLVIVNAVYFKGKWLHPFDKENTRKEDFKLRDGSVQKVDMMKLLKKEFLFKINPGGLKACSCELPYIGKNISMTIILPHEGTDFEEVEKQITHELLNEVFDQSLMYPVKVHLYLPRFKLNFKSELSESLKTLSPLAFSDSADFSGISDDSKGLQISKVIHQAVLEVNEEGTEAAAATAVVVMKRSADYSEEFYCNRPFLFIIHDKVHNGILFFGKYMKPE